MFIKGLKKYFWGMSPILHKRYIEILIFYIIVIDEIIMGNLRVNVESNWKRTCVLMGMEFEN